MASGETFPKKIKPLADKKPTSGNFEKFGVCWIISFPGNQKTHPFSKMVWKKVNYFIKYSKSTIGNLSGFNCKRKFNGCQTTILFDYLLEVIHQTPQKSRGYLRVGFKFLTVGGEHEMRGCMKPRGICYFLPLENLKKKNKWKKCP
ncbi:MAG: hypothetical protein CM15mP58_05190 [Burkholderiaceae bacterium]|nr:MAG: hypothetical protein CM15mP58_05190 [Burkholderiaceae bacterium]